MKFGPFGFTRSDFSRHDNVEIPENAQFYCFIEKYQFSFSGENFCVGGDRPYLSAEEFSSLAHAKTHTCSAQTPDLKILSPSIFGFPSFLTKLDLLITNLKEFLQSEVF